MATGNAQEWPPCVPTDLDIHRIAPDGIHQAWVSMASAAGPTRLVPHGAGDRERLLCCCGNKWSLSWLVQCSIVTVCAADAVYRAVASPRAQLAPTTPAPGGH